MTHTVAATAVLTGLAEAVRGILALTGLSLLQKLLILLPRLEAVVGYNLGKQAAAAGIHCQPSQPPKAKLG